jgi:phytoene synthase
MTPELAAAYEACRRIHADHGRTYYLATRLLPRDRRPDVWALYAFARVSDELVDGPNAQPAKPEALLAWRELAMAAVRSTSQPDPAGQPVLAATWHTMRSFGLDAGLLQELLDSMVMDLTVSRYATWEELRGYMRGSAAVIGELMAPMLGAHGPDALHRAGALGEAFQLTNFIRDVGEDYIRGRIYLPQTDMARFDVSEETIAEAVHTSTPSPQVRSLVAFEVRRAVSLYADARPGLRMVDARSRPCLEAAFTLYKRILHGVIANDFNVFERRITVPTWQRLATVGHVVTRAATSKVTGATTGSLHRSTPTPRSWRG